MSDVEIKSRPPLDSVDDDLGEIHDTSHETPSASRIVRSIPPSPDDVYLNLERVLKRVARVDRKASELAMLPSEFTQLRKEVTDDRAELVKNAARGATNRVALLFAALQLIWELVGPWARLAWSAFRK